MQMGGNAEKKFVIVVGLNFEIRCSRKERLE